MLKKIMCYVIIETSLLNSNFSDCLRIPHKKRSKNDELRSLPLECAVHKGENVQNLYKIIKNSLLANVSLLR